MTNKLRVGRIAGQLLAIAVFSASITVPAYAQIAQATTVMTMVQNTLIGLAVIVFTIAIMWVGYKMAFQHAKWSEVSNVFIGGILVGGAAAIAAAIT